MQGSAVQGGVPVAAVLGASRPEVQPSELLLATSGSTKSEPPVQRVEPAARPDLASRMPPPEVPALNLEPSGGAPLSQLPGNVAVTAVLPAPPAVRTDPAPAPVRPVEEPRAAAPVPPPVVDEGPRVRAALARYEAAYSALNVSAAQAVWPAVNARSLARAFDGLESQRLSLGQCSLAIDGGTARADCKGTATWTPKIGGGTRREPRNWRFELRNTESGWQIVRAEAR